MEEVPEVPEDAVLDVEEKEPAVEVKEEVAAFEESAIVSRDQARQILEWIGDEQADWSLIYKTTYEEYKAEDFHRHCDGIGPTVTVCSQFALTQVDGL